MAKIRKPVKIIKKYKGFTIEVWREECLGGWDMIYYSIWRDRDGWEFDCGFYDSSDTLKEFAEDCKIAVDDYYEHPEDYEE